MEVRQSDSLNIGNFKVKSRNENLFDLSLFRVIYTIIVHLKVIIALLSFLVRINLVLKVVRTDRVGQLP